MAKNGLLSFEVELFLRELLYGSHRTNSSKQLHFLSCLYG